MTYLLDTSIVSVPVTARPNLGVLTRLDEAGSECAIASPVWHELVYGCRRLPPGRRRSAIERYVHEVVGRSFPVLPYDEAAAEWHAGERARLEAAGRSAPFVDGQIAAVAHVHGLVLVTLNQKDFAAFTSITVENWSRRSL